VQYCMLARQRQLQVVFRHQVYHLFVLHGRMLTISSLFCGIMNSSNSPDLMPDSAALSAYWRLEGSRLEASWRLMPTR
jgi:hypothetical protein